MQTSSNSLHTHLLSASLHSPVLAPHVFFLSTSHTFPAHFQWSSCKRKMHKARHFLSLHLWRVRNTAATVAPSCSAFSLQLMRAFWTSHLARLCHVTGAPPLDCFKNNTKLQKQHQKRNETWIQHPDVNFPFSFSEGRRVNRCRIRMYSITIFKVLFSVLSKLRY